MGSAIEDELSSARQAITRHAWEEAFRGFKSVDAEGGLEALDLEALGKAAWWSGDRAACIDAHERAYGRYAAEGEKRGAARVALMLCHNYRTSMQDGSAAHGWLKLAARQLTDVPECAEYGYLARGLGLLARRKGDEAEARRQYETMIAIGTRLHDPNLVAWGLNLLGNLLVDRGEPEEGFGLIDESCAAAVGGELGSFATGIIYCNTIAAYRDVGQFARAGEWSDAARRWCERQAIGGFPGICRVHRAELLRLRGHWATATEEALKATAELKEFIPYDAGAALNEIGEIRIRIGDLVGAEEAFQEARQLGKDPEPGWALLLLLKGNVDSAVAAINASLADPGLGRLERAGLLPAQVEIALAARRPDAAVASCDELDEIAATYKTSALLAMAACARGSLEATRGEAGALALLRRGFRFWHELDAPYEAAKTRIWLAEALRQAGDRDGWRQELEAARATFQSLGARLDTQMVEAVLKGDVSTPVPARTCCFMFTDVAGSTHLAEAMGDEAWAGLISWHDATLRELFVQYGGQEVDHAGDGFFVSFPDAKSATACACEIQRKLHEHRHAHGFAPGVRIGLHSTSAHRQGSAYRGHGVHVAARIAAQAEAGQILASPESVPVGANVSEPRTVTIKGVRRPLELVEVSWR